MKTFCNAKTQIRYCNGNNNIESTELKCLRLKFEGDIEKAFNIWPWQTAIILQGKYKISIKQNDAKTYLIPRIIIFSYLYKFK